MKKKTQLVNVKSTIYPFDIIVTTGDVDVVAKYLKKEKSYELSQEERDVINLKGCDGRNITLETGHQIILLHKHKTQIGIDVPILAHELSHAILSIFERVGVGSIRTEQEPFAYYMSHAMRIVLEEFDK